MGGANCILVVNGGASGMVDVGDPMAGVAARARTEILST